MIPLSYRLSIGFGRHVLIPVYTRFSVTGAENVPREGPLIIASNHLNDGDPGILCASMERQITFMTKSELFKIPVLGQFLRAFGAFPVRRGEADLSALRTASDLLKSGLAVCIFPEGRRSGKAARLSEAWPGAALVALRTDTPILPIAITGSQSFGLPFVFRLPLVNRPRVSVTIGEPFQLAKPARLNAEAARAGTQQIMAKIAALLPPEYRGYYGNATDAADSAVETPESR